MAGPRDKYFTISFVSLCCKSKIHIVKLEGCLWKEKE